MAQAGPGPTGAEAHLYVADLARSLDFFNVKLGFSAVFTHGEPPFFAQVARGAARLNLRFVDEPVYAGDVRERESLLSASITVESSAEIEQLFLEYQAVGLAFVQPLTEEPWGARDFIVADPDGNLVLFAGPGGADSA
jgi:catechol 2,3-dioxygenase-like lactoylglutathione lyase family enzyme